MLKTVRKLLQKEKVVGMLFVTIASVELRTKNRKIRGKGTVLV